MESRRSFLRSLAISAIGAGILLTADTLARASDVVVPLLKVKVVYNLMARFLNTSDEYFSLRSPASVRDLLNVVIEKYPSLSPMLGDNLTMMILVNGVPSHPAATLKDGDEVDLIPLYDGG